MMKKKIGFSLLLLVCCMVGTYAQSKADREQIEQATAELTALYQLDDQQQAKMWKIQERRFRNLQEIEPLRTSDHAFWLEKRAAIRQGTEGSVERLLKPEQRAIFTAQQVARRLRQSELIRQLRAEGASEEQIRLAILEDGD